MGERDTVFAIYKYLTSDGLDEEQVDPSYYLIRVFDNTGAVESAHLFDLFQDIYPEFESGGRGRYIGPFPNLTIVNKFAFRLCENLDANRICLLSVMDYNNIIDSTTNITDLTDKMLDAGNVIENIEKEERSKGLLSKLFNS
ncbi:MAG: hypothetical protein KAG61_12515 [Bacteriovoracaceae bacterium]|nr:hypothetical protein [Bacteriovoracaceae bacterium]